MRPGVVIVGVVLMALVGLAFMLPVFDGKSILGMYDRCQHLLMDIVAFFAQEHPCRPLFPLVTGLLVVGVAGLITMVVGLVLGGNNRAD